MKKITKNIKKIAIIFFTTLSILSTTSALAFAQSSPFSGSKGAVCNGIGISSGGGCPDTAGSVNSTIIAVLDILTWIIGPISVIVIMIAGFRMITSNGDANTFNSARNTIFYASIGIVVVSISQIIVQFVLNKTTG